MHGDYLAQFANQQYLNLESCKRDGTPVQTPVWFGEDDGTLYIYSLANAGRVKRIRRNPLTLPRIVHGAIRAFRRWVEAQATIADATTAEHGHMLLLQKYGWKKRLGNIFSGLMKRERVVMTIRLVE